MNNRVIKAGKASDIFGMETSTKGIDRACKLMNDAILIMRKWSAALEAKRLKSKVDDETGMPIDTLIENVGKVIDKATSYAVKLSVLKEDTGK